jgi:hypothetical protein
MSKYKELRLNTPELVIKEGVKEVIFTTISCMCDNKGCLRFKKIKNDEFKLDGIGFSILNWQMKYPQHEIEWKADEGNWGEVIKMINTGTSTIASVISR